MAADPLVETKQSDTPQLTPSSGVPEVSAVVVTPSGNTAPPQAETPTQVEEVKVVAARNKPSTGARLVNGFVGAAEAGFNTVKSAPHDIVVSTVEGAKAAVRLPGDFVGVVTGKTPLVNAALDVVTVLGGVETVANPLGNLGTRVASNAFAGGVGGAMHPPTTRANTTMAATPDTAVAPESSGASVAAAQQGPIAPTAAPLSSVPSVPASLAGLPSDVLTKAKDIGAVALNSNGISNPANAAKQNTQTVGIVT